MTKRSNEEGGPNGRSQARGDKATSGTEHEKDELARDALQAGDKEKINKTLDELNVSTTESGTDQTSKPDTEGSTSSSKNLDEQDD